MVAAGFAAGNGVFCRWVCRWHFIPSGNWCLWPWLAFPIKSISYHARNAVIVSAVPLLIRHSALDPLDNQFPGFLQGCDGVPSPAIAHSRLGGNRFY